VRTWRGMIVRLGEGPRAEAGERKAEAHADETPVMLSDDRPDEA
jgi:hypothetical protein